MELIIGRDADTSKLRISVGQQSKLFGTNGSVPSSVSRQHLSVTINADDTYIIKNLNARNMTCVNGIQVESKTVTAKDSVELGADSYLLEWEFITSLKPKVADIRPLKKVWDNFIEEKKRIRNKQKNIGLLSRVPIMFSMVGGLLSALMPGVLTFSFTIIAVLIMFYGFYCSATDKSADELEDLSNKLQHDYSCPCCKRYLGQPYDQLLLMDSCPYCKAMFRK
jgi:hypothetical protein